MRFTESEYRNPVQMDFVPRERRSQIWQMIIAFSVVIALIFVIGHVAALRGAGNYGVVGSMGIVGLLCFYVVLRKQQSLDLVMTTEYQNMLFAQAAILGAVLCLFVRRDGTIVYANDGLRELFASSRYGEAQTLEALFEQGHVAKTDRERIMQAVANGTSDRLVFPLTTKDGKTQEYILTLEPMKRPSGFMLIRAREYRDTRAGTQNMPTMLRSTTPEKIDQLLARTPVAHYVTDAFGAFEYVNPAFEQMLGFGSGDILGNKLGLQQVLYQLSGQNTGEDYTLADFRGEALLQKRSNELVSVLLNQSLIRDGAGKPQGATGSVLPIAGRS